MSVREQLLAQARSLNQFSKHTTVLFNMVEDDRQQGSDGEVVLVDWPGMEGKVRAEEVPDLLWPQRQFYLFFMLPETWQKLREVCLRKKLGVSP